jgi:hypothetical protein
MDFWGTEQIQKWVCARLLAAVPDGVAGWNWMELCTLVYKNNNK